MFIHSLGKLVPLVLVTWKGKKHLDAQIGDNFLPYVSDSDDDLLIRTWDVQLHRRRVFNGIALLGMLDVHQSWALNPSSFSKWRKQALGLEVTFSRSQVYSVAEEGSVHRPSQIWSLLLSLWLHFPLFSPKALSSTSCEPCMSSTLPFLTSTLLPVLFPLFGSPLSFFGEFQAVSGGSSDVLQAAFPDTPQWRRACPIPAPVFVPFMFIVVIFSCVSPHAWKQ